MNFINVDERGYVRVIASEEGYYQLPEEERNSWVEIENIPQPESITGKDYIQKYTPEKGVYYEYMDRPLTIEEKLDESNKKIEVMQVALDDLILAGSGF